VLVGRGVAEGPRASGPHKQVQRRAGQPGKRSAQPEGSRRWVIAAADQSSPVAMSGQIRRRGSGSGVLEVGGGLG
jgi:hypothetical protein